MKIKNETNEKNGYLNLIVSEFEDSGDKQLWIWKTREQTRPPPSHTGLRSRSRQGAAFLPGAGAARGKKEPEPPKWGGSATLPHKYRYLAHGPEDGSLLVHQGLGLVQLGHLAFLQEQADHSISKYRKSSDLTDNRVGDFRPHNSAFKFRFLNPVSGRIASVARYPIPVFGKCKK